MASRGGHLGNQSAAQNIITAKTKDPRRREEADVKQLRTQLTSRQSN